MSFPENIKGTNKDAMVYVERPTTLHNLLFCAHAISMNYETKMFLLVSSSVRSKQLLCFLYGQLTLKRWVLPQLSFHIVLVLFGGHICNAALWNEIGILNKDLELQEKNYIYIIAWISSQEESCHQWLETLGRNCNFVRSVIWKVM